MAAISTIITVAMTAYSAVTAVKALKDGNILGAVVAGFGAYMGASSLAAGFGAPSTALSASSQGGMLAEQTAAFGAEGTAATAQALGDSAISAGVMGNYASQAAKIASMQGATVPKVDTTPSGTKPIGESISISAGGTPSTGGFMDSWKELLSAGKAKINSITGNLESMLDGSIIAKAGEAVGGTSNLMKLGQMGMEYYGKEKAIDAQKDMADEGYERSVAEAARMRASRGAAPTYVYDFGVGKKEAVR